jgi:hypothetical protein
MKLLLLKLGLVGLIGMASLLSPDLVSAQTDVFGGACEQAPNSVACEEAKKNATDPVSGRGGVLQTTVNVLALISAISAVIIIVISGIAFATSGGNPDRAKTARGMIIYSLVGLVVIALAWTLISFVIGKVL